MEKLAILGGRRTVADEGKGTWPDITPEDRAAVAAVLERGVLGGVGAPEMTALEADWARFTGARHCLLLNSGTAAIHAALHAVGVRPGDEVITSAYTFAGTFQRSCTRAPSRSSWTSTRAPMTSTSQVEARITERTQAIVPVHIEGLPADLDAIMAVAGGTTCRRRGRLPGARADATRAAKWAPSGNVGAFSLNTTRTCAAARAACS